MLLSRRQKKFETEWVNPMLHFAAASEADVSVLFCKWMLDGKTEGSATMTSEVHKENVDLGAVFAHFSTHALHSCVIQQGNLPDMNNDAQETAAGADASQEEMATSDVRTCAETRISPLASSTHRVEAMVRECARCRNKPRRGEPQLARHASFCI